MIIIPASCGENLYPTMRSIQKQDPEHLDDLVVVKDAEIDFGRFYRGATYLKGQQPFCFARNVNQAIKLREDPYYIIWGDDVSLLTPEGITKLVELSRRLPKCGVLSPAVRGEVGCAAQVSPLKFPLMDVRPYLCFVVALLTAEAIQKVGLLDERFIGYGSEDVDYCRRVLDAGLHLYVTGECLVEHRTGESSYRCKNKKFLDPLWELNRRLYEEKWKGEKDV